MAERTSREIESLIQDYYDGILGNDEKAELLALIRRDPEVKARFFKHSQLVSLLRMESAVAEKLGKFEPSAIGPKNEPQGGSKKAYFLAAVLMLLLVAALFLISFLKALQRDEVMTFCVAPGTQWSINHVADVAQEPGDYRMAVNSRLSIHQGVVELSFGNGAKGVVEGPAELEFLGGNKVSLYYGSVWCETPEGGRKLVIQTPNLRVVDLGTGFGIHVPIVNGVAQEEVHVMKGKVRVKLLGRKSSGELAAGQALSVARDFSLQKIAYDPESFFTSLPDRLPYVHWSFDEQQGVHFAADGNRPDISSCAGVIQNLRDPVDPKHNHMDGKFGKALNLTGQGDWVLTQWKGIANDAPRSIVFWLKTDRPLPRYHHRGGIPRNTITSWGVRNSADPGGSWGISLPITRTNVAQYHRGIGTEWGARLSIRSHAEITDGQWHHIASVYSGGSEIGKSPEIKHYIDGVLVSSWVNVQPLRPINTDIHSPSSLTVRFGHPAVLPAPDVGSLNGAIDELYIFAGVLTGKEICHLMQHNTPGDFEEPR